MIEVIVGGLLTIAGTILGSIISYLVDKKNYIFHQSYNEFLENLNDVYIYTVSRSSSIRSLFLVNDGVGFDRTKIINENLHLSSLFNESFVFIQSLNNETMLGNLERIESLFMDTWSESRTNLSEKRRKEIENSLNAIERSIIKEINICRESKKIKFTSEFKNFLNTDILELLKR